VRETSQRAVDRGTGTPVVVPLSKRMRAALATQPPHVPKLAPSAAAEDQTSSGHPQDEPLLRDR